MTTRAWRVDVRALSASDHSMHRSLEHIVEDYWLAASRWTGALRLAEIAARRRKRSVILCYHGVQPPKPTVVRLHSGMDVTPEQFEAHIAWLCEAFDVLPIDVLVERALAHETAQRPSVAVTFDDAYLNNLEYAIPILRKYRCPCTIFVPVGYIDTDAAFWWDSLESWVLSATKVVVFENVTYDLTTTAGKFNFFETMRLRLTRLGPGHRDALMREIEKLLTPGARACSRTMSWQQIQQLAGERSVTFGAHTVGHFAMSALSDDEMCAELRDSQEALRHHVAEPSRIFAYPYGRYRDLDPRAGAVLHRLGFRGAVTLLAGAVENAPRYALPRVYVEHRDDVSRLRAKIVGVDWPFWVARRLRHRGARRLPQDDA